MDTKRLPVREPFSIPDGEFDDLDAEDIALLEKANNGELAVPDDELEARLKEHGRT